MAAEDTPVWFITGCSTGFGAEAAKDVLSRGWRLIATARDVAKVEALAQEAPDRVLALALDVNDTGQVATAVKAAEDRFGRIDGLLNNAGYGYQSSVEEGEEAEIRRQFDTNVFGLFAVTRAVLPVMRRQRSGAIVNVTSVAGLVGFPGSGYYAASKHAVEGWSDALAAEVGPLGIKVVCVEPGPFRTDWAGRSMTQTPNRIADYAESAGKRLETTRSNSGKQAGDPARAARAMLDAASSDHPPRHLVLGEWGHDAVVERLKARSAEIQGLRDLALSTDFPPAERG